jgi:hypothetical protein
VGARPARILFRIPKGFATGMIAGDFFRRGFSSTSIRRGGPVRVLRLPGVKDSLHVQPAKPHSQEWLCYSCCAARWSELECICPVTLSYHPI